MELMEWMSLEGNRRPLRPRIPHVRIHWQSSRRMASARHETGNGRSTPPQDVAQPKSLLGWRVDRRRPASSAFDRLDHENEPASNRCPQRDEMLAVRQLPVRGRGQMAQA